MGKFGLVKWMNNGVVAVAIQQRVDFWTNNEIEASAAGYVLFAPDDWFDGMYPVREAGMAGTHADLASIEATIGEIASAIIRVPFSNAGYLGEGWDSDMKAVGPASAWAITTTFGDSLGQKGAELLARMLLNRKEV